MLKRNFSYALVLFASFFLFALCLPANAHPFDASSGDGTSSTSPYLISTCEQLQLIDSEDGIYLNSHFVLANDIDCASTITWNEDSENPGTYFGFEPIGSSTDPFTGSFDGNNYHINNFYINRPTEDNVALFAFASSTDETIIPEFKNIYFGDPELENSNATINGKSFVAAIISLSISGVNIENVHVYGNFSSTGANVGSLVGYTESSVLVENSSFQGSVDASGDYVGGLIGYNYNSDVHNMISNSNVNADITTTAGYVGGLAGFFVGSVASSSFQGSLDASGDYVGGLIGFNNYSYFHYYITNSNVNADITTTAGIVGGLAGSYYGSVASSSFQGSVDASGNYVGGLIGFNSNSSFHYSITNSNVDADITTNGKYVGGLGGFYYGSVASSSFQGSLDASGDYVGGLIGFNSNFLSFHYSITNSNVDADITTNGKYVGGLGGFYMGSVENSLFEGYLTGSGYVGGLIGFNPSTAFEYLIDNSNSRANIISSSTEVGYVGGLGGYFAGSVASSSFIGEINVKGAIDNINRDGASVGGLVGFNDNSSAEITGSFVEANIISEGYNDGETILGGNVGGLLGNFIGSLTNSSFVGNIESYGSVDDGKGYVGGLVGQGYSSNYLLEDSFAKANIIAQGDYVGGLIAGSNGITLSDSYFEGTINSESDYTGGLFGEITGNSGFITNSFAKADIVTNNNYIGGIYGFGGAAVSNSYFSGNIEGNENVGGLFGLNYDGLTSFSYSKGNIVGNNYIGGISGMQGNVSNSYSEMNIKINGENAGKASGIMAQLNGATIQKTYFSGTIEDTSISQSNILYGICDDMGPLNNDGFWLETSGAIMGAPDSHDEFIFPKTEEELKTLSTFSTTWDIVDIESHVDEDWYINEGYDYPKLFWEDKEYYVEYIAGENGSITGSSTQIIVEGESTAEVIAVPDDGYEFVSWDDGNTSKTRQDLNINSNIIVTANFEKIPESNNSSNSNSSNSIVPKVCLSVEYGDWQEALPGHNIQYREVASSSPSGCYLTEEQREGMERLIQEEDIDEGSEENEEQESEEENNDNGSDVDVIGVMNRERNMVRNVNRVLSNRMAGRILLQVEENGEAWYVDPKSTNKYFMGRPADAFQLMRNFGLGISEANYNNFSTSGVPFNFAGQILLRVEKNGEAYYINPDTLKMHYLGRPADAFRIMRELALGISNDNLRQIQVGE